MSVDSKILKNPPDFKKFISLFKFQLTLPKKTDHKRSKGSAVVIGGSLLRGAASRLTSEMLLRSAVGGVHLFEVGAPRLSTRERFFLAGEWIELHDLREVKALLKSDLKSLVFGPGLPPLQDQKARKKIAKKCLLILKLISHNVHAPMVVDGGGLVFFAEALKKGMKFHSPVVLTPHPKEASDLLKILRPSLAKKVPSSHRESLFRCLQTTLSQYSLAKGSVVLLKGPNSIFSQIDSFGNSSKISSQVWAMNFASSQLATPGSGDVLAGLIAAHFHFLNPPSLALLALALSLNIQKNSVKKRRKFPHSPVIIARDQVKIFSDLAFKQFSRIQKMGNL